MTGKNAKALFDTFALSPSFAHHLQNSIRSQSNPFQPWINLCSLSQIKLLIHKPLSLITKTRIRGLDAFRLHIRFPLLPSNLFYTISILSTSSDVRTFTAPIFSSLGITSCTQTLSLLFYLHSKPTL